MRTRYVTLQADSGRLETVAVYSRSDTHASNLGLSECSDRYGSHGWRVLRVL